MNSKAKPIVIDPANTVHIAVHVQKAFFDPPAPRPSEERRQPLADAVARRINDASAQFSKTGIPTFWVVMEQKEMSQASRRLHHGRVRGDDVVIKDRQCSAIASGNVLDLLRERGAKTLIVSGGYASICVTDTVQDALKEGFQVLVMKDCLLDNQDDMDIRGMFTAAAARNRAAFTTSDSVLAQLTGGSGPAVLPELSFEIR